MWNLIDLIFINGIDDCNEWLVGEMSANVDNLASQDAENELVFKDDDLTWGEVPKVDRVRGKWKLGHKQQE